VAAVAEDTALQREAFVTWKAGVRGMLDACVEAVNAFKRKLGGVKPIHQKDVRDHVAYYECGCEKRTQCFKATFHRPKLKGKKTRSSEWEIKSVSERHEFCEMQEPPAVAMANRFIPAEIKLILIMAFDQGLQPVDAFNNSQSGAAEQQIAVTWTIKDVQNLYTTLSQMIGEELIEVLHALERAGHFVRVDVVRNAQGAFVLNRIFVATRWMQEQYKLFGKVTLLDSSYGKNKELMPIQGFIGLTSERHLTIFGFASTRSETKYDFEWLFESFYLCYNTLSRTWITDGDEKIYESLSVVAKRHA